MLFSSLEFLFFLIAVIIIYYLIPNNTLRKVFLLVSSYYFYACWSVAFLAILFYETALSYGIGFSFKDKKTKIDKWKLIVSIFMLLMPLLCFKYLNFILGFFGDFASIFGWVLHIPEFKLLLPIGISFYTFMSVGYVIDVYQERIKPEKNVLDYALFIGFFPQIASGPIGRAPQLLPQIKMKHLLLYDNIAAGCRMMLWGFFMKLVVGDRAGIYVDTVFGNWEHHNGTSLLLATFMYTIQIYCDFAGYSLIAIGTAKTMGYELMNNFERPYFSKNIGEFWRRWHISLSTWFRDYVYIPLGGSRVSKAKVIRNTFVIFLLSGFWHGANWTFIVWGAYHAILFLPLILTGRNRKYTNLIGEGRILPTLKEAGQMLLTFILAVIGWIIFRAESIGVAWEFFCGMCNTSLFTAPEAKGNSALIMNILVLLVVEWLQRDKLHAFDLSAINNGFVRWAVYFGVLFLLFAFGGNATNFIYFQF